MFIALNNRLRKRSFIILVLACVFFGACAFIAHRLLVPAEEDRVKEALKEAKQIARETLESSPEKTEKTEKTDGIIVCAGGFRVVECFGGLSWLRNMEKNDPNLKVLPIEWFYAGDEMNQKTMDFIQPKLAPIKFIDCMKISNESLKLLRGFPIKAFAAVHTTFDRFLFLDSDSIALRHPGFLFDFKEFKTKGTIFWRDFPHRGTLGQLFTAHQESFDNRLKDWKKFASMPENESGQFMVDRSRHLEVLKLAWGLNKMKDVFYKIVYGDKDLFALAFFLSNKLDDYYQVPYFPYTIRNSQEKHEAIGQRNPENPNEIIFVHRTHQKRNCLNKYSKYCIISAGHYDSYIEEPRPLTVYNKFKGDKRVPRTLSDMTYFVLEAEKNAARGIN